MLAGRVVGDGEPLWTQEDTDLALALTELEDATCPGCGHDRAESMDKANTFAYRAEPARCHSCAARDRAANQRANDPGWDAAGVRWVTRRGGDDG